MSVRSVHANNRLKPIAKSGARVNILTRNSTHEVDVSQRCEFEE